MALAEGAAGPLEMLRLLRLPALRRGLSVRKPSQVLRLAAFGLLAAFFVGMLGSIFKPMTLFLWQQPQLGPLLSARMLSLVFSLLFLLLAFSALLGLLGRLLQDETAAFFVASPWRPRRYFELCLWETALASSWMLLLLWLPYLWALRRAVGAGWLWFLWGCLAPWPLVGLATGGTALLLGLLVRWVPPRLLRRFLFGAGVLGGLACLVALRLAAPERLADPAVAGDAAGYLASLDQLEPWWWPATWASRGLMGALENAGPALLWWLLGAGMALLAWRAALTAWGDQAWEFWWLGQDQGQAAVTQGHGAFLRPRSTPGTLLEREAVAFWRSPGQGLQMLLLGTLVLLFIFSLGRLPIGQDPDLQAMLYPPVCVVAQVILLAVCARFAFPSASLEKPGAWLLLHAPVPAAGHLRARLAFHSLMLAAVSLPLAVAVELALRPGPWPALLGGLQFLLAAPSLASLGVGLGVAWAKDGVGSAEEALGSASGVLAMVLGFLLLLLQQALLSVSFREAALSRLLPQYHVHWAAVAATLLLWASSHALAWIWPWRMAKASLEGRAP